MNRLAQAVLDGLIAPGSALRRRAFSVARRVMIARGDSTVRFDLHGMPLLLPLSHDLPLYLRSHPAYGSNVGRLVEAVVAGCPSATLVDIGANVGDTAAIVRARVRLPILCIEGDPRFFGLLEENTRRLPDIELARDFVWIGDEMLHARLDAGCGSARLVCDDRAGAPIRARRLSAILADHPRFTEPAIIKIDTDGLDCPIIESELDLLARVKPVLFFEFDPHLLKLAGHGESRVFEALRKIGYHTCLLWENTGEFLLHADLVNEPLIEDLQHHYSGRGGLRYADVAVFHEEERDLAEAVRVMELEFFDRMRGVATRCAGDGDVHNDRAGGTRGRARAAD